MAKRTPWADLATSTPEPFEVVVSRTQLRVIAGQAQLVCRLNVKSTKIFQEMPDGKSAEIVPYMIPRLPLWENNQKAPYLHAHPYALLHLLVNGQVDVNELLDRAREIGIVPARVTVAITKHCALLTMLRVPRMGLMLGTSYNLLLTGR